MNFLESVRTALKAIWVNKMRSFLTMLGIIIGIASVIAIVTLGNGSERMMKKEFETFGVNKIYLYMDWSQDVYSRDIINISDYEAIQDIFSKELDAVSPVLGNSGSVIANNDKNKRMQVNLNGGNEYLDKIENLDMIEGRYLLKGDIQSARQSIVISKGMALSVFGRSNIIGEQLSIEAFGQIMEFNIVGMYQEKKSMFGGFGETTHEVYIPHTLAGKLSNNGDFVYQLQGIVAEGYESADILDKLTTFLERRHDNAGDNKYASFLPESQMDAVNNVMSTITVAISAIAGISLLVGGIGVMNIMLVSVTERTREIGIRKALGATHKEILSQFLIEAVIVSLIGGMIGTLLGIGVANVVSAFAKISVVPELPVIGVAWFFSAAVGVIFGLLPANKAAKLNPIDALRYE